MKNQFRCPVCFDNRTHFVVIYRLAHEVQLDAATGVPQYEAPELETLLRADGTPDVDVRCMDCNYTAPFQSFARQTQNTRRRRSSASRAVST